MGTTFGAVFVHWLIFLRVVTTATRYHAVVLTAWYVLVLALITERFWTYWTTLL
nr:hypothetical protein [Kribbella amoyensis]